METLGRSSSTFQGFQLVSFNFFPFHYINLYILESFGFESCVKYLKLISNEEIKICNIVLYAFSVVVE